MLFIPSVMLKPKPMTVPPSLLGLIADEEPLTDLRNKTGFPVYTAMKTARVLKTFADLDIKVYPNAKVAKFLNLLAARKNHPMRRAFADGPLPFMQREDWDRDGDGQRHFFRGVWYAHWVQASSYKRPIPADILKLTERVMAEMTRTKILGNSSYIQVSEVVQSNTPARHWDPFIRLVWGSRNDKNDPPVCVVFGVWDEPEFSTW